MGTSLSGLTPATTFDGLLKTSDNDALDATLKTIGTGDGTDSILQLSNSAFQVNGEATIVGLTNNTSASAILAQNSDAYNLLQVRNDGTTIINNGAYSFSQPRFTSTKEIIIHQGLSVGQTAAPTAARTHIKGSGATSATTSLLVQNSAGSDVLQTLDNGSVGVGGPANSSYRVTMTSGVLRLKDLLFGQTGSTSINNTNLLTMKWNGSTGIGISGNGAIDATARLHVKGSGNDNTTTSLLVQNSDGADMVSVLDNGNVGIGTNAALYPLQNEGITKTQGLALSSVTHTNVDANEIVSRGAFKLSLKNSGGIYEKGINITAGGVSVTSDNTNAASSTQFHIKGSGATSATTALLVQNSAGTELLKVQDDGRVNVALGLKISNLNVIDWDGGVSAVRYFYQSGVGNHVFYTNSGTERMKLNNDGNLGIGESTPTARLQVKGSGNDATTTALLVQNSDGTTLFDLRDSGLLMSALNMSNNNVVKFNGQNALRGSTTANEVTIAEGFNFQNTIIDNSQLTVKGRGATSATTALLVQNSAGTDLLKVADDGVVALSNIRAAGNLTLGSSGANRYLVTNGQIHPIGNQDLGRNNLTIYHWNNIYSTGVTHITDNTTSSTTLNASAKLQVDSTTQGFLPPRMTTTERDAISTPAAGLMVYNTTTNKAQCYNGTAWQDLF